MSTGYLLEDQPTRGRLLPRFLAFAVIVVLVVGALSARLFYLQVSRGGYYGGLAQDNRVLLQPIPSARGLMYDRHGRELVRNVPAFSVRVRPADLPLSKRPHVVSQLSTLLGIPDVEINESLDRGAGSRFDLVRVASDVPPDIARVISETHLDLPGVEVAIEARRDYPQGPLLSQLVGYTGPVAAEDLEELKDQGYLNDDAIGRTGAEAVYEKELRGAYGVEQIERDASGRKIRVLSTVREPRTGNSLELSVDVQAQRNAEKAIRWAMDLAGLKRGVVVVMNPQTGEILAMVSLPTYDNNLFARGISNADFQELVKDPDQPLLNHAISEQYPPGSTYKLVTGTGGLADGYISSDPSNKLLSQPFLTLGTTKFYEWNQRGWGRLNIYDAFGHSSDTYFFQVAGMLGIDRLAHWARQYGFGEPTGIDLPAEARGNVPTNEWKQGVFGEDIFPGETYQAGIGQGYDTATPIQLLNAYAALANGGRLLKPQIVRRILSPEGQVVRDFKPELIRELDVPKDVLRTMREASRRVVTIRHTYNLVDLPIVVAGKSGTAEFGRRDEQGRLPFHSWFAAFVPKSGNPSAADSELAVLAFAFDSRTKGNVATEIVKYYLQLHYELDVDLRNFDLVVRDNFYRGN
ncbi:MAG: penicillin-binding protein 2 [Chloroflexi bacterium]|nr:penicillin-binding protein 2 [Chloroflexota bacterium]